MMDYYERENFWIELKNSLLNFYNKENKIYVARYEEHKLVEENIIFDKCQTLNTVILSSDGDISLIYINLKGELFLSNFINNKLENSVILTRAVSKNNYMQIASVNNSLNIFYINEVNTISTICFRVLSNRLTLTPAVIIDGVDTRCNVPYIISASNDGLAICYVKIGYPNILSGKLHILISLTGFLIRLFDRYALPNIFLFPFFISYYISDKQLFEDHHQMTLYQFFCVIFFQIIRNHFIKIDCKF